MSLFLGMYFKNPDHYKIFVWLGTEKIYYITAKSAPPAKTGERGHKKDARSAQKNMFSPQDFCATKRPRRDKVNFLVVKIKIASAKKVVNIHDYYMKVPQFLNK